MDIRRRLLTAGLLFLALLLTGLFGYRLIEGWSWLDSLYMTVITLSTVGYGEVHPLSSAGRIFTAGLIVVGVGAAFYALSTAVTVAVEGELAILLGGRRMRSRIGNLKRHYIICGYGRVGQEIARVFKARLVPFVIVDTSEEALQQARRRGYLVCEGNATQDETLLDAGVHRARGLIAASDSDADNTYITLSAKALNPAIFVAARVGRTENAQKLTHAGADRVVSPYAIAGQHMAQSALEARTGEEIGGTDQDSEQTLLAEIAIEHGSAFEGRSLETLIRDCATVSVLAVRHASEAITLGPPPQLALVAGDRVIILGAPNEAEAVNEAARPVQLRAGDIMV